MKKFLGIKKKSRSSEHVTGDDPADGSGYSAVKEKDLPKLHKAAWNGDLPKIRQLVNKSGKKGEDLNQLDKQNRTALHLACVRGHREIVSHLLANKARTNLCDNDGKPALIKAVECKRMPCIELLLENGADCNVVDAHGRGALHVASLQGDMDVVVTLLEHGARIDAQDKNGCSALHLSTQNRHGNIVSYLVQAEAQINCINKEGRTPLIIAAQQGFVALVRLFLENQANITVKDNQGFTAADYALMKGNTACTNMLRDHEGGQSQASSVQGMASGTGRRPSGLSGSQHGSGSGGMRSGTVGLMFAGPAADEEDASVMTGEHSQIDSARGSPPRSDTWASSEEDSFVQDAPPKPKPNLAARLFGTSNQQSPHTNSAAAASVSKPLPNDAAGKKPNSWEAVDMGGTSEEDSGHHWMAVASPPVKAISTLTPHTNADESEFDSDDLDNSDIDAQVAVALTGKAPTTLTFGQKQAISAPQNNNNKLGLLRKNSKPSNSSPPGQQKKQPNSHEAVGGGLGIEYGNQDDLSISNGELSDNGEEVTDLMDSFDQRRRESGSSHGLEIKSLRNENNSSSESSVKATGNEKLNNSNKSPRVQSKTAKKDEMQLAPTVSSDRQSPPEQEGSDDDWDDDEDDRPSTADQGGALSALGGSSLTAPLHARYFQDSDEEDDDIEALAAPTLATQTNITNQESAPQRKKSPVTNLKSSTRALQFGSMTEGVADRESDMETESEDDFDVEEFPSRLTDQKAGSLAESRNLSKNMENLTTLSGSPVKDNSPEKSVSEEGSLIEESRGEWENEQRRQHQIEEQKAQRRSVHEEGGHPSLRQLVLSDEQSNDKDREMEWEKDREERERSERNEAAELLRQELEDSRENNSWDESVSVDESPQLEKQDGNLDDSSVEFEQTSSHVSVSEENEFADEQRLLEEEQRQQLLQAQERFLKTSSPVEHTPLPSIQQPIAKVRALSVQSEPNQLDFLLQEEECARDLEREAALAEEKRLLQAAKEAGQRRDEERRKAGLEEERQHQKKEERIQQEREEREKADHEAARQREEERLERERQQQEKEEKEKREAEHKAARQAERQREVERLEREREQREKEEEKRQREKMKREEAEKELRQLEEERRAIEEREWKEHVEEEERKLSEVRRQREAEKQRRDAELRELQEREEAERQRRLGDENRMAQEAKQRREDEEQRVKEMEGKLRQRQKELKQMEIEAKRRREDEEAKWRVEQERRRDEETRKREEAQKKRQEEDQLWAEEQARQRQEQLLKIEKETNRRREEQEKLLREEHEQQRQQELRRIQEAKQHHEQEMQFWREEQDRRRRDELMSSASTRPPTADLESISVLRQPDGSSPQPPMTPKIVVPQVEKDIIPRSPEKWPDLTPLQEVSPSESVASSIPPIEGQQIARDVYEVDGSMGRDSLASSQLGSDLQPLEPPSYSSRLGLMTASQLASVSRQSLIATSPTHDATTGVRFNETLRETRRMLDKANAARLTSDRSLREAQAEASDLRRKYEDLAKMKAVIDQSRLDIEVEMRSLRYKYEQEQSTRQSSEVLVSQMKDQLARAESRVNQEVHARQDAELTRRNAEIEIRGTQTTIQQLERQAGDLKLQLTRERNSHTLKEEAYSEQLKLHQQLQLETKKTLEQKVLVQNDLKSSTDTCHDLRQLLSMSQTELATAKQQFDVDRRRYTEHMTAVESEIESLRERLQEKENMAAASEQELVESQRSFVAHGSDLKSKIALLDVALDRENGARQAAEVEMRSLKSRLESKVRELEHTLSVNNEMERAYQEEKESWKQEREALLHDVTRSKDSSQALNLQLNTVETKLQSLEKELQSAHLQLAERGGQLAAHGKESEVRQQQMYLLEDRLRQEKELNSQLSTKVEAITERMTSFQGEAQFLRQQLDIANSKLAERDKTSQETQERFSSVINSLRSDIDKNKEDGEVRNRELVQQVIQLKEELARSEAFNQTQERETRRLQQELLDSQKRQACCEGSLDEVSKARSKLEYEKSEYEKRVSQLQSQVATLESEFSEAKHRVTTLANQLGDSERAGKESLLRLETAAAELAVLAKLKTDFERCVGQMSDERHQLEAALQAEKEKTIALREELEKADKIRARLESRVNDLKGDSNDLDDQLKEAKAAHSLAVQEAEEARGLWETEVKSRSKLGMKLLELERNQSNIRSTVDSEKKKTKHALGMRRAADYKVEALHDRNSELQKEVGTLRGQLKSAKRQIRDLEASQSHVPTLTAEFSRDKSSLENSLRSLRQQLDQARQQAMDEGDRRRRVQSAYDKLKGELGSLRSQTELDDRRERESELMCGELQKANRRLEEELLRTKALIGTDYVSRAEMEAYRKDIEAKARAELNRKLEEINAHLEEQSLARESMERMRSEAESRLKNEHEKSVTELKTEVIRLRSSLHDGQVKFETAASEAKRYKGLFEREAQDRESVTSRLLQTKDELSKSKAKLHVERHRARRLLDSSLDQQVTGHRPAVGRSSGVTPLTRNQTSDELLATVKAELDRSVKKHLETAPRPAESSVLSMTNGDFGSSVGLSKERYLSDLKRNYFV